MGELINKNDYRYLAALSDIKEIGAETPPMLHEDTPRSLGIVTTLPATASTNQWIVWNGGSAGGMIVGDIYMWDGSAWVHKDPTDASAQGMYMASLSDIMSVVPNVAGRFSTVFTNLLMAQEIIVGKTIKSSNFDGVIDADGHITSPGSEGFAQTKAGEQVINNSVVRGYLQSNAIKCSFNSYSGSTIGTLFSKLVTVLKKTGPGWYNSPTELSIEAHGINSYSSYDFVSWKYTLDRVNISGGENEIVLAFHVSSIALYASNTNVSNKIHNLALGGQVNLNIESNGTWRVSNQLTNITLGARGNPTGTSPLVLGAGFDIISPSDSSSFVIDYMGIKISL